MAAVIEVQGLRRADAGSVRVLGLDPYARRDTWEQIRAVRASGVTVVVVTHFMEEAERLCDRVAVVDRGRVVAFGTPRALTADAGAATLDDAFLALTGRRPLHLEETRMEQLR